MTLGPVLPGGAAKRRFGRAAWLALLLLCCGVVLRVLAAYPSHKYAADADCAMNGLCAFEILRGHHQVFSSGVRIGSLGAYLSALSFLLFGVSRDAHAVGPLAVSIATLLAWSLFLRELLGRRLALLGLPFAAVLSPAVHFWTYQPNGYPETLLLCATTLWLAARLARGDVSRWTLVGLGLSAGLGWWQSLQTLQCTVPALLWLGWRQPGLWRRRGAALLVAGGLLVGALPWIEFNLQHPWGSFRSNYAVRRTYGVAAMLDNARYLVTYDLPELVASTDPVGARPVPPLVVGLHWLAVATCLAAAVFLLVSQAPAAWQARRPGDGAGAPPLAAAAVLFALVAAAVAALTVISEAGAQRGLTVRYVLPLYLLVPALLAILLARLRELWPPLPWTLGCAIVILYVAGANLPGTERRETWSSWKVSDERLLARLRGEHVDAVAGSFWTVYPLSFLSRERILALALDEDPYDLAGRLDTRPLRWALIAHDPAGLLQWTEGVRVAGSLERVDPLYSLFLPQPNPPPAPTAAFMARLKSAATESVRPGLR